MSQSAKGFAYGNERDLFEQVDLSVSFCGLTLENPFLLSAAPSTDILSITRRGLEMGWAGAIMKTTSVEGTGVPLRYPMMSGIDTADQRLSAMGNIDLISEHHIDDVETRVRTLKREFPSKLIAASIMGQQKQDWQNLVKRLEDAGVDLIECSFSCPQGNMGENPGMMLSQSPEATEKVTSWVKEAAKRVPVVIKITPMVADVAHVAQRVKNGGGDAVTASNSIPALMGVDLDNFVPIPRVRGRSTYSGMSGPAIKPLTLRTVAEIARQVDIPISGNGGISTWRDTAEVMAVGAHHVQLCTAVMHHGFRIIDDLKSGLSHFLTEHRLQRVSDLIGKALPNLVMHDGLQDGKVRSRIDPETCIRCGVCLLACRDGGHEAIDCEPTTRAMTVSDERCVGCGLCFTVCPVPGCIALEDR